MARSHPSKMPEIVLFGGGTVTIGEETNKTGVPCTT